MSIRKFLLSVLILAGCVATSTAQSPQTPHDSRTQTPSLAGIPTAHANPLLFMHGQKPVQIAALPLKGNSVCYTIRSYNFEPTDPLSGATRLKGTTTCEFSTNTQLKGAAGASSK